jgi:hypothetical protein
VRTFDQLDMDITRLSRGAGNLSATMQSYPRGSGELFQIAEQQKQILRNATCSTSSDGNRS